MTWPLQLRKLLEEQKTNIKLQIFDHDTSCTNNFCTHWIWMMTVCQTKKLKSQYNDRWTGLKTSWGVLRENYGWSWSWGRQPRSLVPSLELHVGVQFYIHFLKLSSHDQSRFVHWRLSFVHALMRWAIISFCGCCRRRIPINVQPALPLALAENRSSLFWFSLSNYCCCLL